MRSSHTIFGWTEVDGGILEQLLWTDNRFVVSLQPICYMNIKFKLN